MGSVGDADDNALCESFFAMLECELLNRRSLHDPGRGAAGRGRVHRRRYNPHRRHSALDYVSPISYEKKYRPAA
jgi:putative transposase